jgi:cytochrome P450
VRETRPEQLIPAPPFTLDPPHHAPVKRMLVPPFKREAVARPEPRIRATCRDLTAAVAGARGCDAVRDYATRVASRTMTNLLGVPESDDHLLLN